MYTNILKALYLGLLSQKLQTCNLLIVVVPQRYYIGQGGQEKFDMLKGMMTFH